MGERVEKLSCKVMGFLCPSAFGFIDRQGGSNSHGSLARLYKLVTGKVGYRFVQALVVLCLTATFVMSAGTAQAVTQPGTLINNTAVVDFEVTGSPFTLSSPVYSITVQGSTTPSSIRFMIHSPGDVAAESILINPTDYSTTGLDTGPFVTNSDPTVGTGLVVPTPSMVELTPESQFSPGDAIFIEVTDIDQNLDSNVIDTIVFTITNSTGDSELVVLTETGIGTGVFTGFIEIIADVVVPNDGVLEVNPGGTFTGTYTDPDNPSDISSLTAEIVPPSNFTVRKVSLKNNVFKGDFVQYKIFVENNYLVQLDSVLVIDTVPNGFRFVSGSAKIGGLSNSTITPVGGGISFNLGTLNIGTITEISYILEVGAGAQVGSATNTAIGQAVLGVDNITSNIARVDVQVRQEFMETENIIMGRVVYNDCEEAGVVRPAPGIKIFMEDGTFVVTDKDGMYHIEGASNGSHVVQLDDGKLDDIYEVGPCEENTRTAGVAHSQFVDLQGGTLWRADFTIRHKPAPVSTVSLELISNIRDHLVEYIVPVEVGSIALENTKLTVILPQDVDFVSGSAVLDSESLEAPREMSGSLTFDLGSMDAGYVGSLVFLANAKEVNEDKDSTTKAVLMFDTAGKKNGRTPVVDNILEFKYGENVLVNPIITIRPKFASLSAVLDEDSKRVIDEAIKDIDIEDVIHTYVTGHSDSVKVRNKKVYNDNYELSTARAESVLRYMADELGIAQNKFSATGVADENPIADNKTPEGRSLNRRVVLEVLYNKIVRQYSVGNKKGESDIVVGEVVGLAPWQLKGLEEGSGVEEGSEVETSSTEDNKLKSYSQDDADVYADSGDDIVEWLLPVGDFYPSMDSMNFVLKFDARRKIIVKLNGEEVPAINFDGKVTSRDGSVAISSWRGVDLLDGGNYFEVVELNEFGDEVVHNERVIHYTGAPVRAELSEKHSTLIGDGVVNPVVAFRLFDKYGEPAREGMVVQYSVDPPHGLFKAGSDVTRTLLTGQAGDKDRRVIGKNGILKVTLKPTTTPGDAVIRLMLEEEREVRAWIGPDKRDWILVGIAEGTTLHRDIKGNMELASQHGLKEGYEENGRMAFYTKGYIKGDWLITASYDSQKDSQGRTDRLHSVVDPGKYYTLYGDGSNQQYDSSTSRKLYLRIERQTFYALFGDYDTGLTQTELSRYNRTMNGFKAELKHNGYKATVFASETNQVYIKDEMLGDGTSGLYKLSRKDIVANSESVIIEVRDRFASEKIISTRRLSRYVDYEIDYTNSTIFFREPIASKDSGLNPQFIVVEYESRDVSAKDVTYGGRVSVSLPGDVAEIGVTHIHEGRGDREASLTGFDTTVKLGKSTELKAEVATTNNGIGTKRKDTTAYTASVSHRSGKVSGKVFMREEEEGFGMGQQNASEAGKKKGGFELKYDVDKKLSYTAEYYRATNTITSEDRDAGKLGLHYKEKLYTLYSGVTGVNDSKEDGTSSASYQLTIGGTRSMMNNLLKLRFEHNQSGLERFNKNTDYPTRTTFGADFELTKAITLFMAEEFTNGADQKTHTTRVGMKATPWKGAEVRSALENMYTESEERLRSNFGLKQTLQFTDKFSIDGGIDDVNTIGDEQKETFYNNYPNASATDDFTAGSIGANYIEKNWATRNRIEVRHSSAEDKVGLHSTINGEPWEAIGLALTLKRFDSESKSGVEKNQGAVAGSFVYRPLKTKLIVLNRLEYVGEDQTGGDFEAKTRKTINNLNLNYKVNHKVQTSFQYGLKYSREQIDSRMYDGYTDLFGLEVRYDIDKKTDFSVYASTLNTHSANQHKYNRGFSIGYNVEKNIWISVGYNFSGFDDRDFDEIFYRAEGAYIKFRMKFDTDSVKDAINWLTQR